MSAERAREPIDREIRVGLVGFGLAGSVFHAPLIAATPGLRLVAVSTSDPERQRRVAREYPGATALPRAADLLALGRESLDLVVIGAPNGEHVPLGEQALARGLHVVVDKPFAPTVAEGERLRDRARAAGLLAVPYHNRRWDGDFLTLRRLVAEGALGRVHRMESRFERWRPAAKPRWTTPEAAANGEGILHDIGTHLVDQALLLFGPARTVHAELDRRRATVTVPDDAFVAIEHRSGVRTHLLMTTFAAAPGPRFTVHGDAGAWVKHGLDVQEPALKDGMRPGDARYGEEPEARWGVLTTPDGAHRTVRTEPGAYARFYAGVAEALRTGGPPPVTADEAIAGLAVLEAAMRSAAEGRVVSL